MKKISLLLLFLLPCCVFSQFSENFSDGIFQSNPSKSRSVEWLGDVDKFMVNDALQLQLNAPTTGSPAQLRTASGLFANAYWEFWLKMDFNPTSSNYVRIFLCSDEDDLTGTLDGLFVRVGYTNKNVSLILSQKGKNNKTLIEGLSKRLDQSSVAVQIKVTLNKNGDLVLFSKLENEPEYVQEGTCPVSELLTGGKNFGIVCYFTSTRSKSFHFDDFLVRELRDDEQGPSDPGGNTENPEYGDIIFSEIMANPGGSDPEYIELYNASEKTFNLKNCLYYYGDNSYKLPDETIPPNTCFVLTKTTTVSAFPENVRVIGVTSFPTLANTGKLLSLTTDAGNLVAWFEYSDQMYRDNIKKGGGWSLECIDLTNKSNTASNWIASDVAGGTPGRENSVKNSNVDTEIPEITAVQTTENSGFRLTFSKPMDRRTLSDKNSYTISDPQYEIIALQSNDPKGTELDIQLSLPLPQGELIELVLAGVRDLSGFALADKQVLLGSGHTALPGEILIGEILFNPPTGGTEYVEVYNHSDKSFDLRLLQITSRKPSDGSFNKAYPLATAPLLFHPGDYLVVTKSRDLVCSFFSCRPESFFTELSVMPSLANASGCVVLLNSQTEEIVDEFAYDEKMHAEGISNKKGISLERSDFNRPSNDPGNWHSASAGSGFGTPGYANSQGSGQTGIDEGITVAYPTIGSDSYIIHYQFNAPGYRCKAIVFDASGRSVNIIANNELLGAEGNLVWNGQGNSGRKLTAGIYIIYMEIYDTKGNVKTFRKPAVVK
ncbi:MAG: lamin tail domain-containing protein [Dysgonamonadaceae bacterium]|jgi:hypothetical protein|nr:lamin tail domain-containing protein [Dysgonamonadaceae bacterium]